MNYSDNLDITLTCKSCQQLKIVRLSALKENLYCKCGYQVNKASNKIEVIEAQFQEIARITKQSKIM